MRPTNLRKNRTTLTTSRAPRLPSYVAMIMVKGGNKQIIPIKGELPDAPPKLRNPPP
jgi:hypothetical protein